MSPLHLAQAPGWLLGGALLSGMPGQIDDVGLKGAHWRHSPPSSMAFARRSLPPLIAYPINRVNSQDTEERSQSAPVL